MSMKYAILLSVLLFSSCALNPLGTENFISNRTAGRFVLCPPPGRDLSVDPPRYTGDPFRILMKSPSTWSTVRSSTDVLSYYDSFLNNYFRNEELDTIFDLVEVWDMDFSLSTGLFVSDWITGAEEAYTAESVFWDRFTEHGATIDQFYIDSAMYYGMNMYGDIKR
ncbi:MAG: hypothetical protein QUS11_00970 [Candidatus Fermentibacter sp.]|nr:hypothetical protein [Candidatus Fermentibacter sp.]